MVTLKEFIDPIQAGLMQSMLQAYEIDAVLLDQGASAWTAGRLLVPIRLVVPSEQASEAAGLLRAFSTTDTEDSASAENSS